MSAGDYSCSKCANDSRNGGICTEASPLAACFDVHGDGWVEMKATAAAQEAPGGANAPRKHSHYFKDVSTLQTVDVYRVLSLFEVTDPCLQHAVKKLLVAGGRGAGKDIARDVKEAMDTLARWVEMRAEDQAREGA